MNDMLHGELTGKILEACFEVSNELGVGYVESVYEKALLVALTQKGIRAQAQVPLKVSFRVLSSVISLPISSSKLLFLLNLKPLRISSSNISPSF